MRWTAPGIAIVAATSMLGITLSTVPSQADDAADDSGDYRMQLVLDASGSMKERAQDGTKIKAAKQSLDSVIDDLPESAQVGLRVYGAKIDSGQGACTDSQEVVSPDTGNRDDLHAAVDDYQPLGETPIGYALEEAAKDLGSEGKRTIVLVSDGEPTCKPNPCKVAKSLSKEGIDLRIDVVGLDVDAKTRRKLTCIADAGNGTYYDADDAESLTRSIDTVSTRAFRPFDLTGEPVKGSDRPGNAPTLDTSTQYLDKLPRDDEIRYYRFERRDPKSTFHVGVTARSSTDSLGSGFTAMVYAQSSDTLCGSDNSYANSIGADRPLLATSANTEWNRDNDECMNARYYTVAIENTTGEIAHTPIEIFGYEEPPLADSGNDDLPPADEGSRWSPMSPGKAEDDTVAGTSLANAPVLDDGTYSLDIQTGETQVFAVPLDWGQRLQVQIDAELPEAALQNSGAWSGLGAQIYGSTRSKSAVTMSGDEPASWTETAFGNMEYADDAHWRTGAMTPTVRYLNRDANETELAGSILPGYQYVEVNLSLMKDGVLVPYDLTVKRFGEAGEGAPEYEESDGLSTPSADSTYTSVTEALDGGDSDDSGDEVAGSSGDGNDADLASNSSSDSGSDVPMLALLLGGVGLVVIAGGVTAVALARRPRTR